MLNVVHFYSFFNAAYFYVSDNSQIFPLDIDIDWSLQIESVFYFLCWGIGIFKCYLNEFQA